jgi:ADP-heptose:LPS heptosyltransferase
LLITESWFGDTAQTTPMVDEITELSENINLQIFLRGENEELVNQFLTNGNKAIPRLIILDNNLKEVLWQSDPRAKAATKLVNEYKAELGSLYPQFKEELQKWYNKNKEHDTLNDLLEVLKQVEGKKLKKVSSFYFLSS